MGSARAEGTSGRETSANPSAISLSVDDDVRRLTEYGFDCSSPEARYVVERVSMHRLDAYLGIALGNARATSLVDGKIINHGKPQLKEVHDLITYDRRVQTIILKYTGVLESQFRARYARWMSALHGNMALYDPSLFNRRGKYDAAMSSVARELSRQRKRNRSIARAMEEDGRVPIGTAVEYLTLGTISKLFDNTADREIVDGVSRSFSINSAKARSWMRTIADVRNVCAHFNPYVVRKQIPSTPLPMSGCEFPSTNPFYIFPMLHRMLGHDAAKSFADRNLDYQARMLDDMTAETVGFARLYIGTAIDINVPRRFVDSSVTTWCGTASRID